LCPGHRLRERRLALVFDVANTFQDATSFLARATFLYISRAGFADLGDPRKPRLTRVGNSAACVFTQSLMRPPPGLTSAHFALMSAAQTPNDRSFAIAAGAERSATAPITMMRFIIGHSPKGKNDADALTHLASARCARTNRLCMMDDKSGTLD
jgi:hypothetical protein